MGITHATNSLPFHLFHIASLSVNSPANDFDVHDSWSRLFDHICNKVVFIPGAVRFKRRGTLSWWQDKVKTLSGYRDTSVLGVIVFFTVQKRRTTQSQTHRDRPEQRIAAVLSTTSSVPPHWRSSVQACVSLCSSVVTYYYRGHRADCPVCHTGESPARTASMSHQRWE